MVHVHACLGAKDFGLFRIGGCGLANCMFFATRGLILAHRNHWNFLRPTWERFGIGPVLRREKDKRFYIGMFRGWFSIETLQKIFCLWFCRKTSVDEAKTGKTGVILLSDWWNYFAEMPEYWPIVKDYFDQAFSPRALKNVPISFHKTISVHVRMGDMPAESRVPLEWTMRMLNLVRAITPNVRVLLFTDAEASEISSILKMNGVERISYGNALADIVAMSRTQLIIGTCSTFSWWSAYLTQIPIIQPKQNSGCCHRDPSKFCVMDDETDFPLSFKRHIMEALA